MRMEDKIQKACPPDITDKSKSSNKITKIWCKISNAQYAASDDKWKTMHGKQQRTKQI